MAVVKSLNSTHTHPTCHKGHIFPDLVRAVGPDLPLKGTLDEMDVLVFAVPTEGLRSTLEQVKPLLPRFAPTDSAAASSSTASYRDPLFIFVNKGIESVTNALTLEIIADTLGKEIASISSFIVHRLQQKLFGDNRRLFLFPHYQRNMQKERRNFFTNLGSDGSDPIGVELAGALKNVYAIAAGIADGLGYENNARAGLITRALSEMTRIGTAYGAAPLTFLTLAGVGDLFLTCSSKTSRNFTVGYRLGQGGKLQDILDSLGSVAEGVATAKGAKAIIDKLGIRAPIAMGVPAEEQARWLLEHPPVAEIDLPCDIGTAARQLLLKLGIDQNI
ncbi:hypothetical protein Clacol_004043 [Clathrus columnatus]|uniref:Glycerol-3-phosphate dehydrogenase [NAD(+)] n=1 Tax=Clathrus columnatus TaxID=1419009 RepID=A0AAV5AAT3_9AGAM|nr:hypothetical protein Clacol_004043 [Clathrus columnatus]